MPKYKPTRTEDNLPSRSSPIRKGTMKEEEIKAVAQELTKSSFVDDLMEAKATIEKGLQELQSPVIEPEAKDIFCSTRQLGYSGAKVFSEFVKSNEPVAKGDYRAFASSIKAKLTNQETVELTAEFIKSLFPQNKDVSDIVRNLKRGHGINCRRLDNGNYLLFVEPTKEELIVQLTSAESKVIELEKIVSKVRSMGSALNECERQKMELQKDYQERYNRWGDDLEKLSEENTQLKSDLNNSQKTNKILFWLAIGAVITIIIKSVAL